MMVGMRVEILHIDEWPNWVAAGARVRAALDAAGMGAINVSSRLLTSSTEVDSVPFAGSPTVLIDGVDAFPDADRTAVRACRVYRTETGLAGVPTVEQISEAILQRP